MTIEQAIENYKNVSLNNILGAKRKTAIKQVESAFKACGKKLQWWYGPINEFVGYDYVPCIDGTKAY